MKTFHAVVPTLLACVALAQGSETQAQRPNFIILLTDDQRVDTLGVYNAACPIDTPHIDQLATSGLRFDNGFVTTPICVASRASIISGRYASNARSHRFLIPMESDVFADTYPQHLRRAGYFVGALGKHGVGITKKQEAAYDFFDATAAQGPAFRTYKGQEVHDSAWLTLRTGDFLDAVPDGQAFCLQINYKAPHGSATPAPEDLGTLAHLQFDRVPLDNEAAFLRLPLFVRQGYGRHCYDKEILDRRGDHQPYIRAYYEKIMGVERSVGHIRALLADRGLADNTVIIFLSDHGAHFGERQLGGKWTPYEDSLRIPFIVYDPRPGAARGKVSDSLVLNIDVAPTLLELAGMPVPQSMDGRSLVPLMQNTAAPWRDHFFFEHYTSPAPVRYIPRNEGIRTLTTKYVRWRDIAPLVEEFYDLAADPQETSNVIADPRFADQVAAARQQFEAWRTANPSNYDYAPYGPRPQSGAPVIDWELFQQKLPKEYARIAREVKRLGVTWQQAMDDWAVRYEISSKAGYWY
jgi:arylsulfatase A-like enzyme